MMNVGSGTADGPAISGVFTGDPADDAYAAELLRGGPDGNPEYLDDYLDYWARVQPEARAHTFIDYAVDRSGVSRTLTFAELDEWTRAVAARIMQVAQAGERVAVLTPQGTEYVVGIVAALRSGLIGVPLFAPDLFGHGDRVARVLEDCEPTCLLTTSDKLELVNELAGDGVAVICVDELAGEAGRALAAEYRTPPGRSPDDCAYLQYTSGSTRAPAGVVLTHTNLVTNAHQLKAGHALPYREPTAVSWLPLFHDMGLLLGALGPVLVGAHSVVLDPLAFITNPLRWMRAVADHDMVITAAPNFAYDYAAKRIKQADKETLDLSRVVSLANGAEPIRPETMAGFQEAFASCGVHAEAMRPTYGLAEATVLVSVSRPGRLPVVTYVDAAALQQGVATTEIAPGGRTVPLVSCGPPTDQTVAIVDPQTRRALREGMVGEIWVHGANVGQGYWNKPEESEEEFGGRLEEPGELPEHPWLCTGDLGTLIDGELYITGRIKDLIIVDGRNIYPHDVELTVEGAHDAIAQRRLAAFSVPSPDGEAIVVVAERYRRVEDAGSRLAEIDAAARRAVSEEHGVSLRDFVLVEPDTVTRTSSGKIARQAIRTSYLEGTLSRVPAGD